MKLNWNFPEGDGGCKTKKFPGEEDLRSKTMKLNWNFPEGDGGCKTKKFPVEGVLEATL